MKYPPIVLTNLRGIDVSHYQSNIDWKACFKGSGPGTNDGIRAVSVKCQEGDQLSPDDHWDRNWKGARDAGFEFVDAYLFHRPSADPFKSADLFSERIVKGGGLREFDTITLDLECADAPHTSIISNALSCLGRIEQNLGVEGYVYTAAWFTEALLQIGNPLANRRLWVAHYGPDSPKIPAAFEAAYKARGEFAPYFDWWQWGADGSGSVAGIPVGDHVDHDVFRSFDVEELRARIRAMKLPRTGAADTSLEPSRADSVDAPLNASTLACGPNSE